MKRVSPVASLRDDLIMRSMLGKVGDIPETVLLPVLRLVADDRDAVDSGWRTIIADRRRNRLLEPPRQSWERRYGQFVPELDWACGELVRVLPEPDGTLVYEIPECAMHTAAGSGAAQENSCLMDCKAACEKVFDSTSAMPMEFDPHLPGLSCTLRVHPST